MKITRGAYEGKDTSELGNITLQTLFNRLRNHNDASAVELREAIAKELEFRGIRAGYINLTWHAIDRLTQRGGILWWEETRRPREGLIHFVRRLATEIRTDYLRQHDTQYGQSVEVTDDNGIHWCFSIEADRWVLRTIYPIPGSKYHGT